MLLAVFCKAQQQELFVLIADLHRSQPHKLPDAVIDMHDVIFNLQVP